MSETQDSKVRYALLSAEEEADLAKQIEAGLYAEHLLAAGDSRYDPALLKIVARDGRLAFERFVGANLRLAAWFARRRVAARAARSLSVDDLTSEGVLGLVRGVCKFDYTLGYKFSTYASWWVRRFQQLAVIAAAPAKVSHADAARIGEVLAAEQDLSHELHRAPTNSEIADRLGTTAKAVQQARDMLRSPVSLDQHAFGVDSPTYADMVCAPEPADAEGHEVDLAGLLAALPNRERAVVTEAFGLDGRPARSVAELAQAHRMPMGAIEALLDSALSRLRGVAWETMGQAA